MYRLLFFSLQIKPKRVIIDSTARGIFLCQCLLCFMIIALLLFMMWLQSLSLWMKCGHSQKLYCATYLAIKWIPLRKGEET